MSSVPQVSTVGIPMPMPMGLRSRSLSHTPPVELVVDLRRAWGWRRVPPCRRVVNRRQPGIEFGSPEHLPVGAARRQVGDEPRSLLVDLVVEADGLPTGEGDAGGAAGAGHAGRAGVALTPKVYERQPRPSGSEGRPGRQPGVAPPSDPPLGARGGRLMVKTGVYGAAVHLLGIDGCRGGWLVARARRLPRPVEVTGIGVHAALGDGLSCVGLIRGRLRGRVRERLVGRVVGRGDRHADRAARDTDAGWTGV